MGNKIVVKKDKSGEGLQIALLDTHDLWVKKGVTVETTTFDYVAFGYGSGHAAQIDGTLLGSSSQSSGIQLGNQWDIDQKETLVISKSGRIEVTDIGATMAGWGSRIVNAGTIEAEIGMVLGGENPTSTTRVTNSGTIRVDEIGIEIRDEATETIKLINIGKILTYENGEDDWLDFAYDAEFGENRDIIINKGSMHGLIALGGGDDVYNGAKGQTSIGNHTWAVWGGAGDDVLTGGRKRELFDGGAGNDHLNGGGGRDTLYGKQGQDILKGGKGDDLFIYNGLEQSTVALDGQDTIVDFRIGDKIEIEIEFDDELEVELQFVDSAAFSGKAGEVRFDLGKKNTTVSADFDGDGTADFMINVLGKYRFADFDFNFIEVNW